MDWLSNAFIVLLLTDITGTIFFAISEILKRTPFGRDVGFLRFLMNATLCAFFIPFVYLVFYVDKRINEVGLESDINLFYTTPSIRRFNAVLGCMWVVMFLGLLLYRLYRRYRWTMICRGNIPEEDEVVSEVFENVSAALGISGKVSLYRNDSIDVPCITYHHEFVVMLPLIQYTKEDAEVIFYHELCHFLNHDMYIKTIGCIAALLHGFNPAAHILLVQMDLLCEKYCDKVACKKGKDKFTRDKYFQTILNLLLTDGKKERYQLFALVDSRSNYERRVEYMLNNHRHGGIKKGAALVMAACFLFGSSTSALAAGDGVANAYEGLAKSTRVATGEQMDGFNNESGTDDEALFEIMNEYDLDPEDVVMTDDEIIVGPQRTIKGITWTIPAGKTYMSSGFVVGIGDLITVTVVGTPEDVRYMTGIKDTKSVMHYIEGDGVVGFTYEVDQKGRHYFFVENYAEIENEDGEIVEVDDDLHIEASIIITPKEEREDRTE